MDDFSIDSLNEAVNSAYGKKKSFKNEDLVAPKKSSLTTYNPNLPTAGDSTGFEPDVLNSAVLDAYKSKPTQTQKPNTGLMQQVGQGLASLGDVTIGGIIPAAVGTTTYGLARAAQKTPEEAAQLQQQAASYVSQPFGKAFGVTETPGYKGEATQQLMNFIGQYANKGADWIAQQTGLPKQDVEHYMGLASIAAAPVAGKGLNIAGKFVGQELNLLGETAKTAIQPMQESFEKLKQKLPSVRVEKTPEMKGMGAAEVNAASLRRQRGNELLIPMGEDLTKSQLTRNPADVTYERETAKSPELGGPLQDKYSMQNEKLRRNLQAEVEQTGAELVGVDAPQFGKVISDTVKKYQDERYKDVSNTYQAAQAAGETAQPVSYNSITKLIEQQTKDRPTLKSQNPLYSIVEEELRANDPQGTGTITINQMEDIRKLINEEADPSKKGTVRLAKQLKKEIDASTENAGGDLYKQARAKNTQYEADFSDQGIIRDINRLKRGTTDRVVPLENLADKLVFKGTGEDVKAVFSLLEKMGPEGEQLAKELRGHAAETIRQQATKNTARDVNGKPYVSTAELDKQITALDKSGKLDFLFGPKQAERLRTLNDFTKDLQTVPQGTVNTSGTTATMLSALAEMAATGAATGFPVPAVTVGNYAYKAYKNNKKIQKVQEYANPKSLLSDIGK
jgi:hypothetical protein